MFVTGVQALKPIVATVEPDSVAARAGLESGDQIEAVAGQSTATWEDATLRILDELIGDGRIDLTVRDPAGATHEVELDVRGRAAELTEPAVLFNGLGIEPGAAAVVGAVAPGSPAEQAGLRRGDRVVRADGETIDGWGQWVDFLQQRPGETVELTVVRGDRELVLTVTLGSVTEGGKTIGRIGVDRQELFIEQRYGIFESVPRGVQKTWDVSVFTVTMIAHMVMGEVSLKNMSGPLSIADIAGSSANAGLAVFLSFLATVSISLGILNLLPIPLLDGGQILYQLAEWAKGSPLSDRVQALGQQVGIALLLLLMGVALFNDVARQFQPG
jgi:regulator of sigma E protease